MVDPRSNQLLVVFDDAQKIYAAKRRRRFSLKSVGIQAQGRTTILKINYRNTRQVLELARAVAAEVLEAEASDDDGIPLIPPISCGREGPAPVVLRFPHLRDEAFAIAHYLRDAHKLGHAWGDMAILCRDHHIKTACANALRHHKLPHRVVGDDAHPYTPHGDAIHLLTMHASKGLEFPLVALPGVGLMPLPHTELQDEARLFYVAATRATHQLLITLSGDGALGHRLDAFVTKIVT
jgi:superfamily I DNA/RNA helicase